MKLTRIALPKCYVSTKFKLQTSYLFKDHLIERSHTSLYVEDVDSFPVFLFSSCNIFVTDLSYDDPSIELPTMGSVFLTILD